ncbi:hypothetical protein [Pseudomonas oryzae]|uniref:DUF697 domain-containing protein n=1 Tax=Pseudomonas oryzae TaxID=1392877 RepID=A0A1H1V1D5_9PSED|nr:hypothetical protein [Pseudomonas oryzae]SDS78564.1 hypothetical protein SAMN05216221_2630 [Pseudomonas oryzae]
MLPRTLEELDALRDECKAMVTKRAGLSAGAAVLPIPGLDLGADVALLIELIPAINQKFGLSPQQIEGLDPKIKRVILIGATSLGNNLIGKWVTQQLIMQMLQRIGIRVASKTAAKFVPLLGQALAASISFGAMKLLGNAHVEDCYKVARQALLAREPEPVRVIEVTPEMVEVARP